MALKREPRGQCVYAACVRAEQAAVVHRRAFTMCQVRSPGLQKIIHYTTNNIMLFDF